MKENIQMTKKRNENNVSNDSNPKWSNEEKANWWLQSILLSNMYYSRRETSEYLFIIWKWKCVMTMVEWRKIDMKATVLL